MKGVYQFAQTVTLPKDPPWRERSKTAFRVSSGRDPISTWRQVVVDATELLGLGGDPQLFAGLVINTVNRLPTEVREGIARGIMEGMGMSLHVEEGSISGRFETQYPPVLPLDRDGEFTRESGLIIPAKEGLVVPA